MCYGYVYDEKLTEAQHYEKGNRLCDLFRNESIICKDLTFEKFSENLNVIRGLGILSDNFTVNLFAKMTQQLIDTYL